MKPNKLSIENLETVINKEDKAYCDNLFQQYEALQNLIAEICNECNRKIFEYNQANQPINNFEKQSNILAAQIKKTYTSMKQNSRSLVIQIEKYFKIKYSISFTSLLKTNSHKVDNLMTEYNDVIANIIEQTGPIYKHPLTLLPPHPQSV